MSIRLQCDGPGCDAAIETDDPHLAVNIENEPQEVDDDLLADLRGIRTYPDADHHFCCPPCLAAWAMDRSITAKETA